MQGEVIIISTWSSITALWVMYVTYIAFMEYQRMNYHEQAVEVVARVKENKEKAQAFDYIVSQVINGDAIDLTCIGADDLARLKQAVEVLRRIARQNGFEPAQVAKAMLVT